MTSCKTIKTIAVEAITITTATAAATAIAAAYSKLDKKLTMRDSAPIKAANQQQSAKIRSQQVVITITTENLAMLAGE